MANDRNARAYGYPPPAPATSPRPARGSLLGMGCLGAILGLLLGLCSVAGIAVAMVTTAPANGIGEAAPADVDMTISVQESYFNDMVAQAMPEGWQGNLTMDVQPGNKIAIGGRVKASLFGQSFEGDVSGTVGINAENGLLVLSLEDVEAFGLSLGGLADAFTGQLWQDVTVMVNQQIKNGLGESAEIAGVTTNDTSLVLQVRLP